jgi:hypothetical protein
MRHLLMDPAFPDIVGEWAERQLAPSPEPCANDNDGEPNDLADPLFEMMARREIAATRLW